MKIISDFPIYKISQRVFRLDNFQNNFDMHFLKKFCDILDLGQKFIPSYFNSLNNFFQFFLFELDTSFTKLNNYIFFEKNKKTKDQLAPSEKDAIEIILSQLSSSKRKLIGNQTSNIPIQHETLSLRNELIKKFTEKDKFMLRSNLKKDQINCIKKFYKEKPFILCNSDKNVGWVLLDKELYLKLSYEHLNNNSHVYKKLSYNPLGEVKTKIKNTLEHLNNNGHISNRLFKRLLNEKGKNGKFKILAKLHKPKFSVRPIINNKNHPTELLSEFIDIFLQPFVKNSCSYLKDSQHLLQCCNNLVLDKSYKKYSLDFESLYTNIDTEKAIYRITEYFKDKIKYFDFDIVGFNQILKLVLHNNIFTFNNEFFIQTNGLAMGSKCGPMFANMYVYILEKDWIRIHNPTVYKRFIDDIFLLLKYDLLSSNFLYIFDNLKLNIVNSERIQFLDLDISDDELFDKLSFGLYTKPTNTFQYLVTNSNHPKHIFVNIPKSLFIRLRRICSQYIEYLFFSRKLISQLLLRGYEIKYLLKLCFIIGNVKRERLIPYKDKKIRTEKIKDFKFIVNFDINYITLKFDFLNICKFSSEKFLWLKNYNFSFINSTQPNLNHSFINLNSNVTKYDFKTKKCLSNCSYCKYKYEFSSLNFNTFFFPTYTNSCCQLEKCVYILICIKCNCFYIGQTSKCFKQRLYQHLNNIKNFEPIVKQISEISTHFNLKNHNKNDLRFLIFKSDLDDSERYSIENDLINIFINLKLKILNEKIPNQFFIKKFSFN